MTVKITRYPDGQMQYETPYQEGKVHGVVKSWHRNKRLQHVAPFKEGKRHGTVKWWYDNGKPMYEGSFEEGIHHGIERHWNEYAKLEYEHYYLYGNKVTEEEFRKHELIEKLSGL